MKYDDIFQPGDVVVWRNEDYQSRGLSLSPALGICREFTIQDTEPVPAILSAGSVAHQQWVHIRESTERWSGSFFRKKVSHA